MSPTLPIFRNTDFRAIANAVTRHITIRQRGNDISVTIEAGMLRICRKQVSA